MSLLEIVQQWLNEHKSKYILVEVSKDDDNSFNVTIDSIRVLVSIDDKTLRSTANWNDKLTEKFGDEYFKAGDPLFFDKLTRYFDYLYQPE